MCRQRIGVDLRFIKIIRSSTIIERDREKKKLNLGIKKLERLNQGVIQ